MSCEEFWDKLLSAEDIAAALQNDSALKEHLASCAECRGEVAEMNALLHTAQEPGEASQERVTAAVLRQARSSAPESAAIPIRPARHFIPFNGFKAFGAAAAACAAMAVLFAVHWTSEQNIEKKAVLEAAATAAGTETADRPASLSSDIAAHPTQLAKNSRNAALASKSSASFLPASHQTDASEAAADESSSDFSEAETASSLFITTEEAEKTPGYWFLNSNMNNMSEDAMDPRGGSLSLALAQFEEIYDLGG